MTRTLILALLAISPAAFADPPGTTAPLPADAAPAPLPAPAPIAPPPSDKLIGVGYKLGNGIGFFGGDVIINPMPHLSIDLYGTYLSLAASNGDSGSAVAFAPAIQGHLYDGQRSTPYAAIGMQYVHMTLGPATGSGEGVFANLGWEWKWRNGFGVQLGGGVQYLAKVSATNGITMISTGGGVAPNLELGLRYMFL